MDFSKDGNYLLTGSLDGSVKLWLTSEGHCLTTYRTYSLPVWYVRFNPQNRLFIVLYSDGYFQLFNTDSVQETYHMITPFDDFSAVSWSPKSNYFFLGYTCGIIMAIGIE